MNLLDKNIKKLIVADDNPEFIEGIEVLISTSPKYEIIETFSNGHDLVYSKNLHKADILLVDIEMPKLDGLNVAKTVNKQMPFMKMIALTMHIEKIYLEEIILAGYRAFIYKPEVTEKLFSILEMVISGDYSFPENLQMFNLK